MILLNNSTTSLSSPSEILVRISSKSFIKASSDLSKTQIEQLFEITKLMLLEVWANGLVRSIVPSSLNFGIILFIMLFNFSLKFSCSETYIFLSSLKISTSF